MNVNKKNTPNYLKVLNKKKIMRYIAANDKKSRTDIAQALMISKPTVSLIVDELINEEWIFEKESHEASVHGGRKPIHLYLNPIARYMIGIDIGGTNIEIGLLNIKGDVIQVKVLDTQSLLQEDMMDKICDCVFDLMRKNHIEKKKVLAIGVGAPGITDTNQGIVLEAPSLGWVNYPLRQEIHKRVDIPVYVDNDVNVAILGEQWKGKARHASHAILITLGTGIGCGIIVNGELYRGHHYAAGEIGYLITDKNEMKSGTIETFEGYGFLDSQVGGYSIVKKMEEVLLQRDQGHPLKGKTLTAKMVFEQAMKGEDDSLGIIDEALEHLAFALVNVISILNPQCVVLAGGLSKSGHWFLPRVQAVLDKYLPLQTKVVLTELEHISIIGTGALCLSEHESLLKHERMV